MTFLSFSWLFDLLAMLHGVLDSNIKLCAFYCQWTHQGEIEKPSGQFLGLICNESLTCMVCIRIQKVLVVLPQLSVRVENHVCLSCCVQVTDATWRAATRIVVGVGDLV
jgi:uncharacterized membrane protein YcfT